MFRVIIVDDEPSVLEGLKLMVPWKELEFELCGEATEGSGAFERIERLRPHLVITDVRMPNKSGLELVRDVRANAIDAEFVILSGYSDFIFAQEAMRYRVSAYLLKPLDREELICALRAAKDKLDAKFLACYGFSQADIEAFRGRGAGGGQTAPVLAGVLRDGLEEELETAVRLMNRQDALRLAGELFDGIAAAKPAPAQASALVHGCIYRVLRAAYERRITLDRILPPKDKTGMDTGALQAYLEDTISRGVDLMLEDRRQTSRGSLYEVRRYIEQNFDRELSVASLAEMVYLDTGYLGDAFNRQFGLSILEYQHRLRIERAVKLIEAAGMTLGEVAAAVGYNNYNNFFTHFVRITGTKPAEYARASKA